MTKIAIILDESGGLEGLFTNDEIEYEILQRGLNDERIEEVEICLEAVEITDNK